MERRSRDLQSRINDVRRRLRSMRTVTNTASAQISGGETIIDSDGSLFFGSGGRLVLGGSTISDEVGNPIISSEGNLSVESLTVYGDVLSAYDYLYQRESFMDTLVDSSEVGPLSMLTNLSFPDWSSSALVTYYLDIRTRIDAVNSNKVIVRINGKPVARPRSDITGNIEMHSYVTRRMYPGSPSITVEVEIDGNTLPTSDSLLRIKTAGVYTA